MKFGYGETSPRLYLLIAGLIWVQVISGCSERQQAEDVSPTPQAHQAESYDSIQEGMELATADSESAAVDTDIDEEARERLRTLGYTATARVTEGTGEKLGTVLHQPEEAYRGYNLFTLYGQAKAYLYDMDGNLVHTWASDVGQPETSLERLLPFVRGWRYAKMLPTGELLVVVSRRRLILDSVFKILTPRGAIQASVSLYDVIQHDEKLRRRVDGRLAEVYTRVDGKTLQEIVDPPGALRLPHAVRPSSRSSTA